VNVFDIYGFVREPGQIRDMISIGLGILGTVFIWLMSRALSQGKKEALYYWLAAGLLGYARWGLVDTGFEFNIFSIALIGIFVAFTVRLFTWVKNRSLA
jgi:hypothetical protein